MAGRRPYLEIEDLVTAADARSQGYGGELFDWLVAEAARRLPAGAARVERASRRRASLLFAQGHDARGALLLHQRAEGSNEDSGHRQRRASRRSADAHVARARNTARRASTSCPRRSPMSSGRSPIAQWSTHCMRGVTHVLHAATLHKPHVATHSRQEFVDTNVTGTLNLLEAAVANEVRSFVFTSTTSTFRRRAHAAARARPPRGSPKTWCRSRRTSTA